MRNRATLLVGVLVLLALTFTSVAYAKTTKYTFNDVDIEGQIVEIEASVKTVKKGDFSTCSFYSDEYLEYLGYYEDDVLAGITDEELLDFCVSHFDERQH